MQRLEEMGYEVLSSGWPDLLVAKDGRLHCVVELKSFRDDLRPNQLRVHESLRSAGVIDGVMRQQSRARGEWLKAKQRRAPEKACKPGSVPRAVSRPG
jgi:hypothetical protein